MTSCSCETIIEEKLSIDHRLLIGEALRGIGGGLSEYSFANLYLFREVHNYRFIKEGDFSWIRGISRNGREYIMPACDISQAGADYLEYILEKYRSVFPVPERCLSAFNPANCVFEYDEGDSDYIYTSEKIAEYRGKQMHKKKNLLNQFLAMYDYSEQALSAETLAHAAEILDGWLAESEMSIAESDYAETREALSMIDELSLSGTIYYADGRPAGFILGERLTDDSYALHFAKGLTVFKGIYPFMYNSFAKSLREQYGFLNFEQDLGSPALRQAKASYRPDMMLKKYMVSLKA